MGRKYTCTYEECKQWCRDNKVYSSVIFKQKLTENMVPSWFPRTPWNYFSYRKEWISFKDFFGGTKYKFSDEIDIYKSKYEKCSSWCWENNVKDERMFHHMRRNKLIPDWFPKNPRDYFKRRGLWISDNHFYRGELTRLFKSYKECSDLCKKMNIKSKRQYMKYRDSYKIPRWTPSHPEIHFKFRNKWQGWDIFLQKELKKVDVQ